MAVSAPQVRKSALKKKKPTAKEAATVAKVKESKTSPKEKKDPKSSKPSSSKGDKPSKNTQVEKVKAKEKVKDAKTKSKKEPGKEKPTKTTKDMANSEKVEKDNKGKTKDARSSQKEKETVKDVKVVSNKHPQSAAKKQETMLSELENALEDGFVTPPPRRLSQKSPPPLSEEEKTAEDKMKKLAAAQEKAEQAMKGKAEVASLLEDEDAGSNEDSDGEDQELQEFLKEIVEEQKVSQKESTVDDEKTHDKEKGDDGEDQGDHEEDEDEEEAEEDEDEEDEEEEEGEDGASEKSKDDEDSSTSDSDDEDSSSDESEAEEKEAETKSQKGDKKKQKKNTKGNSKTVTGGSEQTNRHDLVDTVAKTKTPKVRNSVTMKKEWDAFVRSASSKAFPSTLAPMYLKSKNDLFELWLDGSRKWGEVELQVQRKAEQQNLNRKQWQAQKGKDILAEKGQEKWDVIRKSREDQGLFYKDPDFPNDPLETWYYLPVGAKIRQDNMTSTAMQVDGRVTCDQEMLASITAEGPLARGALPDGQAASEQGAKKLAEIFGEVAAPPKPKKRKTIKEEGESSEVVKPKTMVELAKERMAGVLSESAKAREKSIALSNVDYAGELATGLKQHGVELEKLYYLLQKSTNENQKCDTFYAKLFEVLDKKHKWYEGAQASADAIFSGLKKAANKGRTARGKKKEGKDNQSSGPAA